MTTFSLREAAEAAHTSKSTIWRAIKAGRMSAARTDDGGFAIDPAELFRVFQPEQSGQPSAGQDTTSPRDAGATDETPLKQALAVAEANLQSLTAMLEEVKASRDDLRRERDEWKEQAKQLRLAAPIAPAPAPTPSPSPASESPRRAWFGWRKAG